MLRDLLEPLWVKILCGEFVAFEMLARGTRRVVVAILVNGSCGDGVMNTAAAIHKDMGAVSLLAEEVGAGKMVVVYGMAGRGS
jgi:hypothetical protein